MPAISEMADGRPSRATSINRVAIASVLADTGTNNRVPVCDTSKCMVGAASPEFETPSTTRQPICNSAVAQAYPGYQRSATPAGTEESCDSLPDALIRVSPTGQSGDGDTSDVPFTIRLPRIAIGTPQP